MPEMHPLIEAIVDQENNFVAVGLSIMRKISPLRRRIFWSDTRAEPVIRAEVAALMRYVFLLAWSRIPPSECARRDAVARLSSAMYGDNDPDTVMSGIDFYRDQGPTWAFWHNLYKAFDAYPSPEMHVALARTLAEKLEPVLELLKQVMPEHDPEQLMKQKMPAERPQVERSEDLAKVFTRWTLPGCLSLPFLALAVWVWRSQAESLWRIPGILLVLALLGTVFRWAHRKTRTAQSKNAELDAYLDQVEETVRGKLLQVDRAQLPNPTQLHEFVQKFFLEELHRRQGIPSSGSLYWDRTLLIANLGPRVERLVGMLRGGSAAPPCGGSYLMRLTALTGLAMFVVGFTQGGFFGALTGSLATILIGTSLGVLFGDPQANVASVRSGLGIVQRAAALVAGALTMAGVILGGWHWGWAWSLLGFLIGITLVGE